VSDDARFILIVGLPIVLALVGVVWALLQHRIAAIASSLTKLEGRFEQRAKDRDAEYVNTITAINKELWPLLQQVKTLEKDQQGMRDWKHLVVDKYLPRAVEEHERRLNKLDAKVFNGQRGDER